jgi:hypothetical protein
MTLSTVIEFGVGVMIGYGLYKLYSYWQNDSGGNNCDSYDRM